MLLAVEETEPEPAPNAIANQRERLLTYLRRFGAVGPLESWRELGIYRLAARIHDLRRAGHDIRTDKLEVTNHFGESMNVAWYIYADPRGETSA